MQFQYLMALNIILFTYKKEQKKQHVEQLFI